MLLRTTMFATILSAALTPSLLAQGAPPQGTPPQGGAPPAMAPSGKKLDVTPMFDALDKNDKNKDDKISREEWRAPGCKDFIFDMFDADKDGFLTKEELASANHPPAVDANNDGKLTLEEFLAYTKHIGAGPGGQPAGGSPPNR